MRIALALSVCAVLVIGDECAAADPLRLDNGLTVFLRPIAEADRVNVLVVYGLGQDHDPAGKSGRAHLLEPLYVHSAAGDRLAETVEQRRRRFPMGANAQTGFDHTWISTTCGPEELEGEIKDAAARMLDLRIAQADLDQEKPRVLLELRNMYSGIPQLAAVNTVRAQLRPRPDGGRFGGNDEILSAITVQELQELWRDYYKPNNAVVAITGKFDPTTVRQLINVHFAPISAGKPVPPRIVPEPANAGPPTQIQLQPIIPGAKPVVALGYVIPWPARPITRRFWWSRPGSTARRWSSRATLGPCPVPSRSTSRRSMTERSSSFRHRWTTLPRRSPQSQSSRNSLMWRSHVLLRPRTRRRWTRCAARSSARWRFPTRCGPRTRTGWGSRSCDGTNSGSTRFNSSKPSKR